MSEETVDLDALYTLQIFKPQETVLALRIVAEAHAHGMEHIGRAALRHTEPVCFTCGELSMIVMRATMSRKPSKQQVLTPVTESDRCVLPRPHPSHEHRYIRDRGTASEAQGHTYCRGTDG